MAMLSQIQVSASVGFPFIFSPHPSPIHTQIPDGRLEDLKRNLGKIRQEGGMEERREGGKGGREEGRRGSN